ncbi:LysR family transcriptional regulator [Saccharopolyspora erythraea]|uniref:LysR family transcriptional regulator n=1 Tax=Saccharopolyspora erythraea TaxID=1836 RepID=UPI001BAE219E|nr:LysR family transcriptional regulator [Saccharopolyspora erythraea]QUH03681.1 LysR family transcriptional regulator [Saccharopolyspora erythraea]
MDARRLEYFLAIVDHDGFGRAAQELHIAQPSLSQAIAGLERELGVRLFHRIGRGAVLSDAGRELIAPARQVLRDLRTARATMDSLKGVRRGRVELVTMPSPGIEPLGTLTRLFTRRHPGVTVGADAAFTPEEVVRKVREGVCELGLVGAPGSVQAPGVDVMPLESQDFVLVGASDVEFPAGNPVPRTALAGARLIVSPPGSLMRRIVDEVLASGADLEIVAEVAHRTSILPLVTQGVGLAVLPAAWAPLARRAGARAVRIDPPAQLHVALISRSAPLTPAARAFLDVARSYTPVDHLEQPG